MNRKRVILLSFLGALGFVQALNINTIEISGTSQGKDDENPIEEGNSFTLRCSLSSSEWIHCGWSHIIEDRQTSDNQDMQVYCSSSSPSDSGKTCENTAGTVDSSYASRITMDVSSTNCGIKVKDAMPEDNGKWKCHVAGLAAGGQDFKEIEVFVSNKSSVIFKNPDQEEDDKEVITYDISDSNPEIEAKCRAYGGIPEPSFVWYFEDDKNEIDSGDYTARITRGNDPRYGEYIEESLSWEPTLEDLCKKYDLDQDFCQENKMMKYFEDFNFNLLCKADQGDYYQTENERDMAEVIVEVTNGVSKLAGNLAFFSAIASATLLWRSGLTL